LIVVTQLSISDSTTDTSHSRHRSNFVCLCDGIPAANKLDWSWHHTTCNCSRSHWHRKTNRFSLASRFASDDVLFNELVSGRWWFV